MILFDSREQIFKYLEKLSIENKVRKPFSCPNLVKISEHLRIGGINKEKEDVHSIDFRENDLLCVSKSKSCENPRCHLQEASILLDDQNRFVVYCVWSGYCFEFKIKEAHSL